jgi:hypothetical protein
MLLDKKILVKRNGRTILRYAQNDKWGKARGFWMTGGGKASFALELDGGKLTHRPKPESW